MTQDTFKTHIIKSGSLFAELFGISKLWSFIASGFIVAVLAAAASWLAFSTPAKRITLTTGPEGGTFARYADKYRPAVEGQAGDPAHPATGIKLAVVTSLGSQDNLEKLLDPAVKVDGGFVLSKVELVNPPAPAKDAPKDAPPPADPPKAKPQEKLVSLGCVAYQPLFIFYRADAPLHLLSDFAGKHLSIGAAGGGTNALATTLLEANGVTPKTATLTTEPSADAAKALLDGATDAVFLMGESASSDTLKALNRTPGVRLFDFEQAEAYTRKFTGLSKLRIPQGGFDFGKNIPAKDITLIGPTVQLVVREKMDSALCPLLLDGAKEAHGRASLLQNKGDFPAPVAYDFEIDDAAANYYKTGKSLLYRHLPFRLATGVYLVGLVFLPTLIVLLSGLRGLYGAYKFSIQFRINRCYRILLKIERERFAGLTPAKKEELLTQVAGIERNIQRMKIPAGFVSQFYGLRQHIEYVRGILANGPAEPAPSDAAA